MQEGAAIIGGEELFREWQQGSVGAFEALVRRYHAPLVVHLYRLLGDIHLAEDLAQETFLRVVRYAHSYRYPRPFLPWLYTIAHHLVSNEQKSGYRKYITLHSEEPDIVDAAPTPVEWVELWEQHHGLQKAILELDLKYREILSLRFGQELDVKEIAEILAIPVGTVKSRTFTALRLLRASLEKSDRQGPEKKGGQTYG